MLLDFHTACLIGKFVHGNKQIPNQHYHRFVDQDGMAYNPIKTIDSPYGETLAFAGPKVLIYITT